MPPMFPTVDLQARYQLYLAAINRIAEGETMTAACRMVNISTRELKAAVQKSPELAELYVEAEQAGYDTMAENLVTMQTPAGLQPQLIGVWSKNVQWFLGQRAERYRKKEAAGAESAAAANQAVIEALTEAVRRIPLPPAAAPPMIDITPEVTLADLL